MFDPFVGKLRAIADVDLDGAPDLLRFAGGPGAWLGVTPLLGLGTMAFVPGTTTTLAANMATLVATADLDGDLRPDLVASTNSFHPSGIGLLFQRGLPGGVFAPPVHYALPRLPQFLVVGRANGDTLGDIAVMSGDNSGWTVRWLQGVNAQAPTLQPALALASPASFSGLAAFDRDGDGDDDLAVAEGFSNQIVLLDTQNGVITANGGAPVASGFGAMLAGIDIDGDADDDLLVVSPTLPNATITRFLNQGGALTASQQSLANLGGSWHAGDLDGDGDADLVQRMTAGLRMVEQVGGSFVARDTIAMTPQVAGAPLGLTDMNGDGHLDFVDESSVWFGGGTFATEPVLNQAEPPPLDWEDDGDIDLLRPGEGAWRNDGTGRFEADGLTWPPTPGPNFQFGGVVLTADFDGDGGRELLVPLFGTNPLSPAASFQAMHLFEDSRTGQLIDEGPAAVARIEHPAFAIDTNGDGTLDVVDRSGIWVNNSQQFSLLPQATSGYLPIAAGDLDGDGDIDLLAGFQGSTLGIGILWQTGPHTLTLQVISPAIDIAIPVRGAAIADLDGDGDLDFAVDRSSTSGSFEVWSNQGGTFSLAWSTTRNGPAAAVKPMVGDFDVDSRLDLAFGVADTLVVFRRNGPGLSFDPAAEFLMPSAWRSWTEDVDGDGDTDVVGPAVQRNRRFTMPEAGRLRQFGASAVATGGIRPILGCTGPPRAGFTAVLRLRAALGGTISLLGLGLQPTNLQLPSLPGITFYTYPLSSVFAFVVSGAPGVPGDGGLDIPLWLPPGLQGAQVWFQHFVLDTSAPTGFAHTNGLEFTIGT